MQIAQVVASVESASAGPSYSVPNLSGALAQLGHRVDMLSIGASMPQAGVPFNDVRLRGDLISVPVIRKFGFSKALKLRLGQERYDILHTHGLWMMPNIYPAQVAKRSQVPLVISPRGMLGEAALEFSSHKKKIVWALLQGPAARHASCLHATSEQEYIEIRRFGLRQPVAIISNGVDLPNEEKTSWGESGRYVLSLGRIHRKKGLDRLLRAWAEVQPLNSSWSLRIVGPDDGGHSKELQRLIAELGLSNVSIEPPVYGHEKQHLMGAAQLFVLPTRNENFALTVAESLASGTPVISTKGAPWKGLEEHRCGWWVDQTVTAISEALRVAMSLSDAERAGMGGAGRAWMASDFSWTMAAEKMASVYAWLLGQAAKPPWIQFD